MHFSLASAIIRDHIDALKANDSGDGENGDDGGTHAESQNTTSFGNIYLGAPQKRCSFEELQITHADDPAFHQFQTRFAKLLNELLRRDDSPVQLQSDHPVPIAAGDFVSYLFILKCNNLQL